MQCSNGYLTSQDCAEGTVFNPKLKVCDWPDNVPGCSKFTYQIIDAKTLFNGISNLECFDSIHVCYYIVCIATWSSGNAHVSKTEGLRVHFGPMKLDAVKFLLAARHRSNIFSKGAVLLASALTRR